MSRQQRWHGVSAPAPPSHYRRLLVLTALILAALGGLLVQLVNIQVLQGETLRAKAERMRSHKEFLTPRRGRMVDRSGVTLAHSMLVKTVVANPSEIGPQYAAYLAGHLAGPLGMDARELTALLASDTRLNAASNVIKRTHVRLKKGVTEEQWTMVRDVLSRLDLGQYDKQLTSQQSEARKILKNRLAAAISAEPVDEQVRIYPQGTLAANLLGFVGHNPRWDDGLELSSTTGAEGLELSLNSVLEGIPGWRIKRKIFRGSKIFYDYEEDFRARSGLNVMLSVESELQRAAEKALARGWDLHRPESICCVMVEPRTGEILAMANLPTFDPNEYGSSTPEQRRNRAVTDAQHPGSTFKVVSFGVGIEQGVVAMGRPIDCGDGVFLYHAAEVTDVRGLGRVPLEVALAKSSNVAAAKIGVALGADQLYRGIARFGIGRPTGIPLPAEAGGLLWPPEKWTKDFSPTHVPYGYEVSVTPLQMTMAVAAVANGGRLMHPLLVKRVEDSEGRVVAEFGAQVRGQAVSEDTARQLVFGMRKVIEEGTGHNAALDDYAVAGKTGTALKYSNGRWNGGYLASFIGFFPAQDPQVCIGVFVNNPKTGLHTGGGSAAPIFQEIAREVAVFMGIPPSESPANLAARPAPEEVLDGRTGSRM